MTQTLKSRYDQPDLMLQCYITEIQNVKPAVREPPDPKEQRRFYDQSYALLQRVKRCGMDINHMTLRQTLLAKLSPRAQEHVLQAYAHMSPEEQTTEKTLETLEVFVRHLERSAALTDLNKKFNRSSTPVPSPTHRSYAAVCKGGCESRSGSEAEQERYTETEHVNAAYRPTRGSSNRRSYTPKPMGREPVNQQRRRTDRCIFCLKRDHTSMKCTVHQSLRRRQERLRERRMCARCTAKDHTETNCRRQLGQCVCCSRRGDHIALLCPEQISRLVRAGEGRYSPRMMQKPQGQHRQTYEVHEEQPSSRDQSPYDSENESSDHTYNREGVDFSDNDSVYGVAARRAPEESHVHVAGADERTVLQCVQAKVMNPNTHETSRVRIFLDTGSSQTFINLSVAKEMNLKLGPPRPTTVLTFGRKRTDVKLYATKFCLLLQDGSKAVVKADATDDLTAYMPMVERSEVEEALRCPEKPVTIIKAQPDILLGLDYLHLLRVTPRGQKLENGFCVYDTEVGPILAGQGQVANPDLIKSRAHFCFRALPEESETATEQRTEAYQVETKKVEAPGSTETEPLKISTETSGPKPSEWLTLAEKILSLEGLGIKPEEVTCNDEYVLENFRKNLKRLPDGRYEVRFPWLSQILEMVEVIRKSPAPKNELTWASVLPTNKRGAMARLKSV
ncbi:Zinc knuckle family protein [Aphelenchoides avenae]|nr:Zinc knuckle family protein [Aphelenchus avenae]